MFDKILGQPLAISTLQNALSDGRSAGSYLFVGPDGVGKTTTARQFAKLLCGATSNKDAIARAIDAGTFPDVRLVEPMGPSRIIRIAQLWPRETEKDNPPQNALLRDLHFEPMAGPKRVFIIKDAEGMNEQSGNSLLKTLEEPPAYAHFLLTVTSTATVLPTIVSRCQVIHFGLLPAEAIKTALTTEFTVAPAHAHFLAALCDGRLGRAVALAKSPALLAGRDGLLDLAQDLATAPPIKSFKLSEEFRKLAAKLKGMNEEETGSGEEGDKTARSSLLRGLDLLATYYRDLLAMTLMGRERAGLINIDRAGLIADAAARYKTDHMESALADLLAVRRAIERNAHAPTALDVLFTRLTTLTDRG